VSRTPEPRPALKKAPDGAVHPAAAPRTSAPKHLHAAPAAPSAASGKHTDAADGLTKTGKGHDYKPGDLRARKATAKGKGHSEPTVTLKLEVPKSLRKDARKKAERGGHELDEVIVALLRAWVDG
jgi:hypothetical protein